MMEERYHATTQNRFYPDMSNVNKNITVEAKLISPLKYDAAVISNFLCLFVIYTSNCVRTFLNALLVNFV